MPLARHTPLRSGRAAFPHPAPHVTNRLVNLCVSTTRNRLSSCGITHILRYYAVVRLPVSPLPSSFFVVRHTIPTHLYGEHRLSPVDMMSLYYVMSSSTAQQCVKSHHIDKPTYCFPLTPQCQPADSIRISLLNHSPRNLTSYA